MHKQTEYAFMQALIAAERHGWQLTWGDAATVLYVAVMAILGAIGAIVLLQ